MSVKLIVEVLDHYHGPHARKLWLIAWAEKVPSDGSRAGYCKREVLAARLGVSASRASKIARELEDEGVIKRLGGGVWGKAAVYELLPLDTSQGDPRAHPAQGDSGDHPAQGDPRTHPMAEPEPHAQGDPRSHAQGDPRAHPNPHIPHKPSSASRRTTRTGSRGEPAATDDDDDSSIQSADLDGRAEGAPAAARPASKGRAARSAHAWDERPDFAPGYGRCPDCGRWVSVNLGGGLIVPHGVGWPKQECPGSRRRPVDPVPCIVCGNTTVALRFDGKCNTCRRNRR
jgi:hypothetical protein